MTTTSIIFLWAHPRSISTAFERAFIQRNDFFCMHEPYSEAYYVGPERISPRFTEEQCIASNLARKTYTETTAEIITNAEQHKDKKIFCKDMAQNIIRPDWQQHPENPTVLDLELLKHCTHTFLIRNPEKTVPSLYECSKTDEGEIVFISEESGYAELRILYNFLTKLKSEQSLPLIDADDLVKNPMEIMKIYCSKIGIDFQPEMLKWKAEKIDIFKKWEAFHIDAEQSTGIAEIVRDRNRLYPDSVYEAIKEYMPIYEELFRYKINI